MEELLKRWAELEPDRCEIDEQGRAWIETEHANFTVYVDEVLEKDHMLILGATMQAIESRYGWWSFPNSRSVPWSIPMNNESRFKYEACVCLSREPVYKLSNNSPADALLEAYLKALDEVSL